MKKGLSPIIATVLMIVFVITIGLVVTKWSGKLVGGSIEKSQEKIGTDLECANVNIKISEDNDESNNKVLIKNNNREKLEIMGFITRFVKDDSTVSVDYTHDEQNIIEFGAYLFDLAGSKESFNGDSLDIDLAQVSQIEVIPRVDIGTQIVNCESKKAIFKL